MSEWDEKVIAEFRENGGKVGGHFAGWTLVLLHTFGRKTGTERVTPLVCQEDGDRLVIVASKGGAPSHPDWYRNLLAHPEVPIEYGTETFKVQATDTAEPERTRLYAKMEESYSIFTDYKQKAGRTIPVITLSRVTA